MADMFDCNERQLIQQMQLITETLDTLACWTIQDKRLYTFLSIVIKGIHHVKVNIYKQQPNKYKQETEVTEVTEALHMQQP